jgi:membrane associated rhomboid family serine protease/ribosomal protein L37AE/L43A
LQAIQNWLDRFCHKHPRLAVPNLMLYIVIGNIIVFLLDKFSMSTTMYAGMYFSFIRDAILQGQVWRMVTFMFVPTSSNIFFFAISMYFYYFIGSMLEREWGSAKFTIFYLFGVLLNILVGFAVGYTNIYFVNMSLFFAFATLHPDMQVLLFFIIPVKIKWLAWLDGAYFGIMIIQALLSSAPLQALIPVVAVLNYLLFFSGDLTGFLRKTGRKASYHASRKTVDFHAAQQHVKEKKGYLHKCAVCGRTDVSNPELEFRYCSKCNGYYCYCSDHINSHVHIE